MEIILAAKAGFCFGVERALQMAQDTAAQAGPPAGAAVFTLGPLVHNPRVIDRLEQSGVRVMEEPHETSGDYLVIRTHGVPPQVRQQAMERGWLLVDATCPLVTLIHTIVENLR